MEGEEDEKKGDIDFFLSYIKGGNCTHILSQFLVLFPLLSSQGGLCLCVKIRLLFPPSITSAQAI